MAGETLARSPEGAEAPEELPATLAAVHHAGALLAKRAQSRSLGGAAVLRPERAGEPAEEAAVPGARPVEAKGPGVRGFVAQRVLLLGGGEVSGDRRSGAAGP